MSRTIALSFMSPKKNFLIKNRDYGHKYKTMMSVNPP